MIRNRVRDEQGSGTVVSVALVVIALILTGAILLWVAATDASMKAATAADLAALAAADTARGLRPGSPCAVAQGLASANHAQLVQCEVESTGTVGITVSVPVSFQTLGITLYSATARARAGAPPLDQR